MWAAILAFIMGVIKLFVNKPSPAVVEAKEAGAAEADLQTETAKVSAVEAEAQAEADAPKDRAAVVDSLKKDQF